MSEDNLKSMPRENVKSYSQNTPEASPASQPSPPPPPPVTAGRIVHYVPESDTDVTASNHAKVVPAIVVTIWAPLLVNLQVFTDGEKGTAWKTSVPYDADGKPGTWHWPPRV